MADPAGCSSGGGAGMMDEAAQAAAAAMYAPHLRAFWEEQNREIAAVGRDPAEFKNHQLPLARIKKIMKSDEDVRMISAEAPVLFAKACEMFILELTLRGWLHAEDGRRRTLQRCDIATALASTEVFDFLADVVPVEAAAKDTQDDAAGAAVEDDGDDDEDDEAAAAAAAVPLGSASLYTVGGGDAGGDGVNLAAGMDPAAPLGADIDPVSAAAALAEYQQQQAAWAALGHEVPQASPAYEPDGANMQS